MKQATIRLAYLRINPPADPCVPQSRHRVSRAIPEPTRCLAVAMWPHGVGVLKAARHSDPPGSLRRIQGGAFQVDQTGCDGPEAPAITGARGKASTRFDSTAIGNSAEARTAS